MSQNIYLQRLNSVESYTKRSMRGKISYLFNVHDFPLLSRLREANFAKIYNGGIQHILARMYAAAF